MNRIWKEDTENQQVLTRSDSVAITQIAIIQTYKRLIEKTGSELIKKELEEFMNTDISALGM
jgi:hypothetical protein